MAGVKFLKRIGHPKLPRMWTQDFDCYICCGRWTAIHYSEPAEWFDIRDVTPAQEEAFGRMHMVVKVVGMKEYLKATGWKGFKRMVNCLFGRFIFKAEEEMVLEDVIEKEYTNTDEFFAEGPGEDLSGLMPPVVFSDESIGEK